MAAAIQMHSGHATEREKKRWKVSLLCPLGLEDDFASALRELTGAPTCCQQQGDQALVWTSLPGEPTTAFRDVWQPNLTTLAGALGAPQPQLEIAEEREEDWLRGWKKFFAPVAVGERLLVRPPWAPPQHKGSRTEVIIRPGVAFGTGLHATTRMCLEFLTKVVTGGETLADVGTGSGILSIAACKLGARFALAVDNDPLALCECQVNCRENGVTSQVLILAGSLLTPLRGRWDLLVCNIDANAACEIAHCGRGHLARGGRLILTGFTVERETAVRQALAKGGFRAARRRQDGPWVCLSAPVTGN